MKLFLDTNVFVEFIEHRKQYEPVSLITINENDFKNADQSRMAILSPSAFVEKYMNVEPLKPQMPMG